MSRYESKEDLAAKVDWEGGVAEAITGYGIHYRDLPEGTPSWVIANWKIVYESGKAIELIQGWLSDDGEGGVSEPAGDSPDSPPAGESRLPGGSDDYLPVAFAGDDPRDLWRNITPVSPEEFIGPVVPRTWDWPVLPVGVTYEAGGSFKLWMGPDGTWHSEIIRPVLEESK